ncbi:MAG: cell division protein FtsX, partial [Acidimicrobiia bacterium]
RDELPDTAINAMISEVQAWDEVDEVFFFTKAEAYQEAQVLFRDDQAFLDLLNEQPTLLPASIRVKPVNTDVYSTLETRLKATPGVFDVQSASKAIDAIVAIKAGLTQLVLGLAILLGASAIALIANTIRMAIYARRDEIGIMRLVGAGNWFIRIPFLLEGMIEGLVGGLLAIGAIVVGYQFLLDRTQSAPEWITVDIPTDFFFQWGFFTVVFGVVVGVMASGIALWRFMRE